MLHCLDTAPTEIHKLKGLSISVVRADLVPQPPLPPYLKMVELLSFVKYLKRTEKPKCIGYYAQDTSEWTVVLPMVCREQGIEGLVGFSRKKQLPQFVRDLGESVVWLTPNMYKVNYYRMKKIIEERNGYMLPMGVEHPYVVKTIRDFFEKSPLPAADTYIVPVGSGVALSGILQYLKGNEKVVGVCTRPVQSVKQVVDRYVNHPGLLLVQEKKASEAPFPHHVFWEGQAWYWLENHLSELGKRICFVNLGNHTYPRGE